MWTEENEKDFQGKLDKIRGGPSRGGTAKPFYKLNPHPHQEVNSPAAIRRAERLLHLETRVWPKKVAAEKRRQERGEKGVRGYTDKTYFIQGVMTRLIKIGFTSGAVLDRLETMQVGSPDELVVLKVVSGNKERKYHDRFSLSRVRGEWFKPDIELLEFIDSVSE